MQPRLSPPGRTDDPRAGRGFFWVLIAAAVLLLAALFVVLILPSVVANLNRSDDHHPQGYSQAPSAAPTQVDSPMRPPLTVGSGSIPSTDPGFTSAAENGQKNGTLRSHAQDPKSRATGSAQHESAVSSETPVRTAETGSTKQPSGQPQVSESVEQAPDTAVAKTEGSQQRFDEAMSRALDALQQDDLAAARQALSQADSARPDSPAAQELRRQLAGAELARQLRDLASRAAGSERQARWQDALDVYDQALQMDPAAAFAIAGRQRVSDRLALERAIDHYLQDPARLQSPVALGNAKRLLRQLESLKETSAVLRARYQRLAGVLAEAEMTLDVTILSDGATDVVIYPVGRLGRFDKRALRLRPGTYTAVGTRDGFRDVRKVFVLTPGGNADITVRCEEAI